MKSSISLGSILSLVLTPALVYAQQPTKALQDEIVAQERAELEALKTGDMAAFAGFLADDAVFVDASGSAGKDDIVKHTQGFRLHDYTMTDVRFVALSRDSGLIVYQIAESGVSRGKEFSAKVNVSALWVKRNGRWVCVFSQETAAK